jgi:hypothetical protein
MIGSPEPSIGVTGITETWSACRWEDGGQTYEVSGRSTLSGQYKPMAQSQSIQLTGQYAVSPGGEMSAAGDITNDSSFVGSIGGQLVNVGGAGVMVLPTNLNGSWSGQATFSSPEGCSGTATMNLTLTHSGTQVSGMVGITITESHGPFSDCSKRMPVGPIGASGTSSVSGSASNGKVSVTGAGFQAEGEYGSSFGLDWMGGTYAGVIAGFRSSGSWQARR